MLCSCSNDEQGNGLCVRYRHDIIASPEHPVWLCEYAGEDFPIAPTENVSGIPLGHLMYGCEYVKHNGQTVRRAPTKHLMGMAMYLCLLNIYFITSVGVQVCDRRPSVRRVLWLTMHNKLLQD
jgi:hypothetical protein